AEFTEIVPGAEDTAKPAVGVSQVNTFDVAHLADFVQVGEYLNRFYPKGQGAPGSVSWLPSNFFKWAKSGPGDVEPVDLLENAKSKMGKRLIEALKRATEAKNRGEVEFEVENDESRHYFATLHALRAIHALGNDVPQLSKDVRQNLVEGARSFAVEQSFFF